MLLAASMVVVLLTPRAWARSTVSADPSVVQQTIVTGTAPPLEGRWLLLIHLGSGAAHELATLWDVTRGGTGLEVVERFVVLPDAQRTAAERGRWKPSQEDLRAIAQAWDKLPPAKRGVSRVRTEIFGADGFTAEVKGDPIADGARWVVRQTYAFAPGMPRPASQVTIFAATSVEEGVARGRYLSVTVAAVPVPIPIRLEGTFELIPLPSPPWWVRLLDVFRGCGREGRGDP
jgi:hypothetical protein